MPETPKDQPTFAIVLEELMRSRGLSQAALARGLGVWDANVGRWRKGSGIEIENVRKIADFFNVDREYLERLAGYGDRQLARTIDPSDELERQRWRAWFDELREKKVPKSLWTAYTAACEALADSFTNAATAAESALSTDQPKRVSKPRPSRLQGNDDDPKTDNGRLGAFHLALAQR